MCPRPGGAAPVAQQLPGLLPGGEPPPGAHVPGGVSLQVTQQLPLSGQTIVTLAKLQYTPPPKYYYGTIW